MLKVESEIDRYRRLKISAYEDMKDGILTKRIIRTSQLSMRCAFPKSCLQKSRSCGNGAVSSNVSAPQQWIQEFIDHRNIQCLTRSVAAQCIESIIVYEGKRIEVTFTHMQDYEALVSQVQDYYRGVQEGAG